MAFLLMAPALLLGNSYVWGAGTSIMLYLLIALRAGYRQPWCRIR